MRIIHGILAAIVIAAAGCTSEQADKSRELESAMASLNQRQYSESIAKLEPLHEKTADDSQVALLLAEAHLGQAKLELLEFAERILAPQEVPSELSETQENTVVDLFSQSQGCENGALTSVDGYPPICLALRVFRALPHPDSDHLSRARSLLRNTFSDPSATSIDVNFLVAYVELLSALGRIKYMAHSSFFSQVAPEPGTMDVHWGILFRHLKLLRNEAINSFTRAKHSYTKVSTYVGKVYGKPVISVGTQELLFNENTQYSDFFDFGIRVLHDHREPINQEIQSWIRGKVQELSSNAGFESYDQFDAYLRQVDPERSSALSDPASMIQEIARSLLDPNAFGKQLDFVGFVIQNPPQLFDRFKAGFVESWDTDTDGPLNAAIAAAGADISEMYGLYQEWRWFWDELQALRKQTLVVYDLLAEARSRQSELVPPDALTRESVSAWQGRVTSTFGDELTAVVDGKLLPEVEFNEETAAWAKDLTSRTDACIRKHFWSDATLSAE